MEFILSLVQGAVITVVNVVVTYVAKHIIARLKERTAPTSNRDGSDNMK